MSASITIRLATREDYPGFLSVARETHAHHVALLPDIFRSVDAVVPREYFDDLVAGEESCVLLAEFDGVVAGYATLRLVHTTYDILVARTAGHIDNFGVSESFRRMGVGRLLLAACRERAAAMGASSIELDCWEANLGAMRFYEGVGMRVSRRRFTLDL